MRTPPGVALSAGAIGQRGRLFPVRDVRARTSLSAVTQGEEISVSRLFDAPRELVYHAFVDPDQFGRLKQRLEALDEILPDADFEIDDSFALDLSGHEVKDQAVRMAFCSVRETTATRQPSLARRRAIA